MDKGVFMRSVLVAILALSSIQAFAGNFSCVKNPDIDSRKSVELNAEGLSIGFWESFNDISRQSLSVIESTDKENGVAATQIVIANNVKGSWSAEGEQGTETFTAVVVYNPQQKAARVTFLSGGGTMLRNELFTNCK